MVSTQDSESCDPSSNLGRTYFKNVAGRISIRVPFERGVAAFRFYGVMVSTQDSDSCDPSSNLGRTSVGF